MIPLETTIFIKVSSFKEYFLNKENQIKVQSNVKNTF